MDALARKAWFAVLRGGKGDARTTSHGTVQRGCKGEEKKKKNEKWAPKGQNLLEEGVRKDSRDTERISYE